MRRTVTFDDKALEIVEQCMAQCSCSFNQAVNDIIIKFPAKVSRNKKLAQELEDARNLKSQVESILQWVQEHS